MNIVLFIFYITGRITTTIICKILQKFVIHQEIKSSEEEDDEEEQQNL